MRSPRTEPALVTSMPARDPFYTDLALLYDAHQRGVRGDIEFYRDLAVAAGGLTVELGVGTGRVGIPSALAGARVLGLDLAWEMLAICRDKTIEAGTHLNLVQADMRRFELRTPASLITIPHRAFLHNLTEGDQRATIEACRRNLVRGGRLAMNVFNPEIIALVEMMRGAEATEGVPTFDLIDQVIETPLPMRAPDGGLHRGVLRVRYIYRPQLAELLATAGFEVEAWYGDFEGSAFGPMSTEIIVVARAA
ncbi:MAG: class I SAM-dependent methyltransferase [Dehalococcoidia bacterium]|nr:class I SAM-dependent methyltransferase [Dehalococcoidia bacterium]